MSKTPLALLAVGIALAMAAANPGSLMGTLSPIQDADAIVYRPATPVSVAGVARRTTRRVIRRTTIYVVTLPQPCSVVVVEGTTLHMCGNTYYQASGSQYVVVEVH